MKKAVLFLCLFSPALWAAWGAKYDLDALPTVMDGYKVMFVAREPDLMHEVCLCFDAKGRMMLGGGAQFRWPLENTPKDKIKILIDKDGDGKADEFKIFAEGFNCIQAMAWKGKDLWVCHCPAVTIVRDLDGDDVADEFVDVFTGLGPLRHGLHGFNWGPDGLLYMSQGNNTCTKNAPKAWRDLMDVASDAPAEQPLRKFTRAEWKVEYLKPYNDGSEGGILRCSPEGRNAEIWARGMRNPWDIAFDDGFNFVGGDNDDGPEHDRVFHPFFGANMGHRHAWSTSWMGDNNPCTAPSSALFADANGSAVGTVWHSSEHFPKEFRDGFFMGDSDGEKVYFFRPQWQGAQMKIELQTFVWTPKIGAGSLFMPTDVEIGPDGALYVIGWGSTYGSKWAPYHKGKDEKAEINEGRVFRIWHEKSPLIPKEKYLPAKRSKPYTEWTFAELLEDMGHQIPVWRVNAQDEMVRRGKAAQPEILAALNSGKLTTAQETWTLWALGRIEPADKELTKTVAGFVNSKNLNPRIQALRILERRKAMETIPAIAALAMDAEPRIRFEAAQTLWHLGAKDQISALQAAAAVENDRTTFYTQWRALQELMPPEALKPLLKDSRAGLRRAALLALLEAKSLPAENVLDMISDKDPGMRQIVTLWLSKQGKGLSADALARLLSDPDAETRKAGLMCLARTKLSGENAKQIAAFYAKAQGEERLLALAVLGSDPGQFGILWEALNDKDAASRQAASDGFAKHDKQAPAFLFGKLAGASPLQKDGAVLALAGIKKFEWTPDEAKVKAMEAVAASSDPAARRALVQVLAKAKGLEKSPAVKTARAIAEKAATDSSKDVREDAAALCKKLGVKLAAAATITGVQIEQVLPLLAKSDPTRGREVFFRQNTPGCYNCHQMEKQGTALGPDLCDIGLRADGRQVCESILEPSKVIIEGFQPTLIKTKDGVVLNGLVKEETDEALTLCEANGRRSEVAKKEIAQRKALNVSFMPDNFGEILKPQEAADLVSWLLTQKTPKAKIEFTKPDGD